MSTRNIYVGDIVALEIDAGNLSEFDVKEQFHDFEIVEFKEEHGEYLVSVRTFDAGKHTLVLGDKELVINVASTLDDIQREDIFETETLPQGANAAFFWHIAFYIAIAVFIASAVIILMRKFRKRKSRALPPYQLFLRRTGTLSPEDDNYLVDLTLCFKEYLEDLYRFRIIGKTSAEILAALSPMPALASALPGIRVWLTECDRLKFSGVTSRTKERLALCENLVGLAKWIEEQVEAQTEAPAEEQQEVTYGSPR